MPAYPIISADSHVNEPTDLWEARLPDRFRHRAPHDEVRDGVVYRIVEGARPRKMPSGRVLFEGEELQREQSGGWDPAFRLKDQERDGVNAEVIFPSSVTSFFKSPDPVLQMALAQTYNDWAYEVYCAYRNCMAPAAIVPVKDLDLAVSEVYRVAKLGFCTIFIPAQVDERPVYNQPAYDPLWAALQEVDLPISIHVASGHDERAERGPGGPVLNYVWSAQGDGPLVSSYFCCSGVLKRFPGLQFVMVESGAAWIAWIMNAMDEAYKKHQFYIRDFERLDMLPSEYFKRQGHATFMYDPPTLVNRQFTGIDCLMWGNDYPHPEGTWPHSQEAIAEQFAGVPDEEARQILGGNAARLYRFVDVTASGS
jgi:predicted TIM-barrel fold metal-dependent hydrolase